MKHFCYITFLCVILLTWCQYIQGNTGQKANNQEDLLSCNVSPQSINSTQEFLQYIHEPFNKEKDLRLQNKITQSQLTSKMQNIQKEIDSLKENWIGSEEEEKQKLQLVKQRNEIERQIQSLPKQLAEQLKDIIKEEEIRIKKMLQSSEAQDIIDNIIHEELQLQSQIRHYWQSYQWQERDYRERIREREMIEKVLQEQPELWKNLHSFTPDLSQLPETTVVLNQTDFSHILKDRHIKINFPIQKLVKNFNSLKNPRPIYYTSWNEVYYYAWREKNFRNAYINNQDITLYKIENYMGTCDFIECNDWFYGQVMWWNWCNANCNNKNCTPEQLQFIQDCGEVVHDYVEWDKCFSQWINIKDKCASTRAFYDQERLSFYPNTEWLSIEELIKKLHLQIVSENTPYSQSHEQFLKNDNDKWSITTQKDLIFGAWSIYETGSLWIYIFKERYPYYYRYTQHLYCAVWETDWLGDLFLNNWTVKRSDEDSAYVNIEFFYDE